LIKKRANQTIGEDRTYTKCPRCGKKALRCTTEFGSRLSGWVFCKGCGEYIDLNKQGGSDEQ